MKIGESKEQRSYPENSSNHNQLLADEDILLSQKTQELIERLEYIDSKKATIISQAFKEWVNSLNKFEFAKQMRGNAFPLALFLTFLFGILTIPGLLIAPLFPTELVMLLATRLFATNPSANLRFN